MAYVPNSGSVVSFQSNPSVMQTLTGLMSTNASVITVGGAGVANQSVSGTVHVDNFSSVVSYQLAGSILAVSGSFTPAANQSVSGTVGASVIGHAPVFIVGGSILTSSTANQSVSGTVHIDNFSSVISYQLAGSVLSATVANFPTTQNVSGSVVATQGTTPWVTVGSVYQGVGWSGSVVAFQGTPEWTVKSSLAGGIFPVSGSVSAVITGTPNVNTAGSVVAFQGTSPWVVNFQNSSIFAVQAGTRNTSIVSTVPSSVLVGASIFGQLPGGTAVLGSVATLQGTNPWIVNINHSVAAVIIGGSVATATTNSSVMLLTSTNMVGSIAAYQGAVPWAIAGSVASFRVGTIITSLVSTIPSSVLVGSSIFGQLPAGTAMIGSIVAYQGVTPWAIAGSVAAIYTGQTGLSVTSIVAASPLQVVSSLAGGIFPISGSVAAVLTAGSAVIGSVARVQTLGW